MTNEFRKKAVELGKLMNSKSKLSVPLVKCIIECFEIVFDEQDIDYMLLMKDGYYSRDELKELWQLDGEAFEKVFTSIRDKGGIWESRQEGVYDITPIFPGWVELYASGPLNDKRRRLLIKFAEFEELLIKLNIAPVRMYMNRVNERNMQREQGRMSTLIPDPANNLSAKKRIIKINKNVDAVQAVYTEGEVMDILNRNKEHIAVMNCFCRTKKMLGNGKCDYDMPIESCMAVGRMAVQLEKAGVARHISIDEARKLIDTLEKKGCIHTLYHYGVCAAQSDIKRVLAFSTISQIGFMMVALGVCTANNPHEGGLGYMAGMFHLFTHAMFKALLFLGAGCIIHAVHSNEMSTMGGLRKYMPITHITFLIACLAIAGIPPFSGFFSKDEILTACFQFSPVMGWIMTIIAGMTAFYMFRLYYGIFWGTENKELHAAHTPHESPLTMTFPLMFLAAITIVCGWILPFGHFVSANGEAYDIHLNAQVAATSIIVAVIAILLATWMYAREKQPVADMLAARFSTLHRAAYKRFYMDEIWLFVTKKIIFRCISTPLAWFDRHVIDQFMNFMAWSANAAGESVQPLQSGKVQSYTMWFLGGVIVLTIMLLVL